MKSRKPIKRREIWEVWQGDTLVCSAMMRLTKDQAENKVRNEERMGWHMVAKKAPVQFTPIKRKRGVRQGPWRSVEYRRWISQHWCCVCFGVDIVTRSDISVSQAAHTENNGMASKGDDSACVPLSMSVHDEYDAGRLAFEHKYGIDLKAIAAQYYAQWLSEGNVP